MTKTENTKMYDLEDRTFKLAKDVSAFVRQLNKDVINFEDVKQLLRSSGSVGANYIEANEALGKKDFLMRIKISRKEAKESSYWLRLLNINEIQMNEVRIILVQESVELTNIFGAILRKSQ